jgi:hypothetical protein
MTQKIQKVRVADCEGEIKELVLLRVDGRTAYVCNERRLVEVDHDPNADIAVGVPLADVRFPKAKASAN